MIKRILTNKNLAKKERIKKLLAYLRLRRGARIPWKWHFNEILRYHPSYLEPVDKSLEKAHQSYWKPFRSKVNLSTLRISHHISGIEDIRLMPEEVFVSDIEPTLNPVQMIEFLQNKSFYNKWFPKNLFPAEYFHNIDGQWADHNLDPISFERVMDIAREIPYPVVFKPNVDSGGGHNIHFPKNQEELIRLARSNRGFIVQEKIRQHAFFSQYNPCGLNTIRANLYRSVSDDQLHVLNLYLRMGVGGSLDNVSDGGIGVRIRRDGFLDGYAQDNYGEKLLKHPDTQLPFNSQIPDIKGLYDMVLNVSRRIFYARLISLDCCYDADGNWRMIEVNLFNGTIDFAQRHGSLFFEEFTDEVYDYCLKNHWALVK